MFVATVLRGLDCDGAPHCTEKLVDALREFPLLLFAALLGALIGVLARLGEEEKRWEGDAGNGRLYGVRVDTPRGIFRASGADGKWSPNDGDTAHEDANPNQKTGGGAPAATGGRTPCWKEAVPPPHP